MRSDYSVRGGLVFGGLRRLRWQIPAMHWLGRYEREGVTARTWTKRRVARRWSGRIAKPDPTLPRYGTDFVHL